MTDQAEDMAVWPDDLGLPTSESNMEMAALYDEFAEEDRAVAEAGMSDYAAGLAREDDAQWQKISLSSQIRTLA